MASKSDDIRAKRNEALAQHEQRAKEIANWSKDHGGVHHRVSRYAPTVTPDSVNTIIATIQNELERNVHPDAAILLNVMEYLRAHDFNSTDEAGRDAKGFSLALSELEVALNHLKVGSAQMLRYLVYRYRFKVLPREFKVADFPMTLYIESALRCNLMCTMCYQSDPKMQEMIKASDRGTMEWSLYTKIIDEASAMGLCSVVFAGRGEPTLNPRFNDMLKYAHDKGVLDIKFNTNAMLMTEKMVRGWFQIGSPLTVVFSVDAADKKGFEEIRIGASFERVVENIKMFNRIRQTEFPDTQIRSRISMTLFRDDQDPEAARNLWAGLVDEFTAKNARGEQSGSIYQPDANGAPKNISPNTKCKVFFDRLYVWCDGKVNPCEDDYLSKLTIGNAYHFTLKALWDSPAMMKLRIAHLSGKKNTCFPCNGCNGF